MRKQYYIYIMTNKLNSVLYTGVTSNLVKIVHGKKKMGPGPIFNEKTEEVKE